MIAHGKVTGPYARKYLEYCYQKPNKYGTLSVPLLDYTIEVTGDDGLKKDESARCTLTVYLDMNEYTLATKRKRVLRVIVDSYYTDDMNHLDSIVQLVFEPTKTEVK